MTGLLRALACVAALGGAIAVTPACEVGLEGADYPVAYGDYPDGCIATTEAVYYNGYPSYWCGGLWYFRGEGGRWGHYDREPPGSTASHAGGSRTSELREHLASLPRRTRRRWTRRRWTRRRWRRPPLMPVGPLSHQQTAIVTEAQAERSGR